MSRSEYLPHKLSTISAVPLATIKNILNGESKNSGDVTIKKHCNGFGITVGEFFGIDQFNALEQKLEQLFSSNSVFVNLLFLL